MLYVITLDTGTTNTRVTLWKNKELVDKVSREVGVRDTAIDGNNVRLKSNIKEAIDEILKKNCLTLIEINKILASGMITSNVGLVEVPHLFGSVGIEELANGMVSHYIPDVVDKEIWFVPGFKNSSTEITLENCEAMDIMRGEEVEVIGLLERLNVKKEALIILPGSHSKFVSINRKGKITGCLTSLAGELISVITNNTIIAGALEHSLAKEFNHKMVVEGYKNGSKCGINRTIFSVRIIDQFTNLTVNDKANFLLGAVLSDDLKAIKNSSALEISSDSNVIIAGKDILKNSFKAIIEEDSYFKNVEIVSNEQMENLAGFGVLSIARKCGLI
ncbi:MAG: 2-dehydro-3-deoxygalactonokinase [Clostridium sp.]|jgi:2-dehydro-3-deoxygalactonokinase